MSEWQVRPMLKGIRKALSAQCAVCMCVMLIISLLLPQLLTLAQKKFANLDDVQQILASLVDILPPALKPCVSSASQSAWQLWVVKHDSDIRSRLIRGDEDTVVNWLLFGTSFTQQPRAFIRESETVDGLRKRILQRVKDLISAIRAGDSDERITFARRLLMSKGYHFDTAAELADLEQHLCDEVERVVAQGQKYWLKSEASKKDFTERIVTQSYLFEDRGLSLDTSVQASFAIDQVLQTMKKRGVLLPNGVRRVAVIGPGLDFADKSTGYDFYPVQTLQPFALIDSIVRLGLAAQPDGIELTTLDISPRVNDHIRTLRDRAEAGDPYVLRLPYNPGEKWTLSFVSYWKSFGDWIGSEAPAAKPPEAVKGIELRGVAVKQQVATRIVPADFNMVTERWPGPPFDLVIATNVFIYYDRLDKALAFAGIEAMLRPGGFFITNDVAVELPFSRLRAVGMMRIQYSEEKIDYLFWYRHNIGANIGDGPR
jgi:hypothetical protein